jgi:hypothetical protein
MSERTPERLLPTMDEQGVIDYYAEGHSHRAIARLTGWTYSRQLHLLADRAVPLRDWEMPSAGDRPRFLSDAEILRGEEITDAHLAVSERRTQQAEREVAETLARGAEGTVARAAA